MMRFCIASFIRQNDHMSANLALVLMQSFYFSGEFSITQLAVNCRGDSIHRWFFDVARDLCKRCLWLCEILMTICGRFAVFRDDTPELDEFWISPRFC